MCYWDIEFLVTYWRQIAQWYDGRRALPPWSMQQFSFHLLSSCCCWNPTKAADLRELEKQQNSWAFLPFFLQLRITACNINKSSTSAVTQTPFSPRWQIKGQIFYAWRLCKHIDHQCYPTGQLQAPRSLQRRFAAKKTCSGEIVGSPSIPNFKVNLDKRLRTDCMKQSSVKGKRKMKSPATAILHTAVSNHNFVQEFWHQGLLFPISLEPES